MQLSNEVKRNNEVKNPINWETDRCCICTLPLEINPTTSDMTKEKMSYSDFLVAKEQKFFRNIFSEDELSSSDALKNIRSYHENFSRFLEIVVYLQQSLNSIQEFADCIYDDLIQFCGEFCKDCDDFSELKDRISDVTIKSKRTTKISKFTLKP